MSARLCLVFFFVFFLLASGDLFKRTLVKIAGPSLEKKRVTVQILSEIDTQIIGSGLRDLRGLRGL